MSAPVVAGPLTWGERFAVYQKGIMAALFFALSVGTQFLDTIGAMGLALPPSVSTSISAVLGLLGTVFVVANGNADKTQTLLNRAQVAADTTAPPLGRIVAARDTSTGFADLEQSIRETLARLDAASAADPLAPAREALSTGVHADASRAPSVWG